MGADVPLDRSKDSRACCLRHAGNFLVAIHLQEGADRLGWTVDGTAARATRSNRTVRPALSASGRKSAQPGGPGSLERDASPNTVHLRMLMHFAVLTYLVCSRCLGRSGYLLILRFTPRGFHRLRLDTTRSSRISSRIAWCKFFLA